MRSLFLFLSLVFLTSLIPAQSKDSIFPLWMNRKYALVRSSYPHLITLPYYKYVTRVPGSGYFTAKRDDLYGILDTSAKELVKMEYIDLSSEFDQASKKNYVVLSKPGERILVDELGNIIGKGFPTIKEICGGLVIVEPNYRDTSEKRIYYTEKDKYVKQGLMDLKGNWIEKPDLKQYYGIYGRLFYIQDYYKQDKGKFYDLKLNPLGDQEYDDVKFDHSLKNDSLKNLKRIIAYNKEFIWLLDSNGKELKKEIHKKLPIDIKGYSGDRKSFKYNGNNIDKDDRDFDGAFIMDNYLLGFDSTAQTTRIYDRRGDLLFTKNYSKIFVALDRRDNPEYKFVFAQDKTGIYLLDDKLEKKTPALQFVNTDELYKDEQKQLFICKKNNKFGVIDQNGKIIVPFIYKNEPQRYNNGVIKVYGTQLDFYSTSGEQLAKGANDADQCKINPTIYIVSKGTSFGLFGSNPFRALIPFGTYSSFVEYPEHKVIVAKKNDKLYILDKDLHVLNKEPIEDLFITSDSVTFSVQLANKKKQLLSYRSPEPKYAFDWLEGFQTAYDNYYSKNKFFLVRINSKYGLSNAKSDLLLDAEWDTIISIGYCALLKKGKSYFITDEKFEVDRNMPLDSIIIDKIENHYQDPDWRMFKIQAKHVGKWGVFDFANHKWIVYPNFENVVNVLGKTNSCQRYFSTKINKWTYIVDPEKNILYGEGFNEITPMTSDIFKPIPNHAPNLRVNKGSAIFDSLGNLKGGKYGIVDPKGKMLHKCDADKVWPISYSIYPAEGMVGYVWNIGGSMRKFISRSGDSTWQDGVDANGNSFTKKVLMGREYGETMAGGKFGIVGVDGKEIFAPIYDNMIFKFYGGEGLGNYRASYLDTLPKYDHLIFPIFIKKDGKWGVGEFNGKLILPIAYDSVEDEYLNNDQPAIRLVLNGNVGYVDLQGKEIIPSLFSGELRFGNYYNQPELILFQKNGIISTYTVAAISSTMSVKYDEYGNSNEVYDTISVVQKHFSGGTYGFWDVNLSKWVFEFIYEDIRLLQVFSIFTERQIPKRVSVIGKYPDQCDQFIKGYEPFEIKKNGKWDVYFHGKGIVLQPEFEEIKIENEEIITKQAGIEKRFTFEGKQK
ncbi:MAG: WG repeat-containing protein [Sphingobacteriaceae bacterium]|nr:WG repeat-containing protein [Sphingobacteriaceae bacterium]